MRVFVAGASGAIGMRLVPRLLAAGHEVAAMTRSPRKAERLRTLGAEPAVADALDGDAVLEAVTAARPEAVIHELTEITVARSIRDFDRVFATTNRLRTEGADNLLAAARAAGARRFLSQSYGNWNYEPDGEGLKTEADPLVSEPPAHQVESLAALRHLERVTLESDGIEGVALRYGNFYGPGTSIDEGGETVAQVRKRQLPIIGDGAGVWSFIHLDDAAAATVAALERGARGVYNVVDDEPMPISRWVPLLAAAVGAKRPRRLPAWLVRPIAGEVGIAMMTRIPGTSNAKARRELGWAPDYPSCEQGFRTGLGDLPVPGYGPLPG